MKVTHHTPVKYELELNQALIEFSSLVGKEIAITYTGKIFCIHCGKSTKKSYSQGYCFPCTLKLAECDLCIMRPETCHFDKGTCREPAWGEKNCFSPHVVYLANSSGLKVGITRRSQIPIRWIDQGATAALAILEVKNRLMSGQIEVLFKKLISDKTDWRKMLKGVPEEINFVESKERLLGELKSELDKFEYSLLEGPVMRFEYPIEKYPEKVNSISLDKFQQVKGRLMGIKGQYLIFESGVINVRSHSGYEVTVEGE